MNSFKEIKDLVRNSMYCSLSTITKDGLPHIIPIGSVFLENEQEGYYIEMFIKTMSDQSQKSVCIMAVNTSLLYWLSSLIKGRFKTPPATRLLVTIGEKRKISEIERARFQKKVRYFKWLKGYKHMWSSADYVRTFKVEKVISVNIGKMTRHLE